MTAETKLVERLRRLAKYAYGWSEYEEYDMPCIAEAADVIERLQADIARYQASGAELHLALEKVIAERDALRAALAAQETKT